MFGLSNKLGNTRHLLSRPLLNAATQQRFTTRPTGTCAMEFQSKQSGRYPLMEEKETPSIAPPSLLRMLPPRGPSLFTDLWRHGRNWRKDYYQPFKNSIVLWAYMRDR